MLRIEGRAAEVPDDSGREHSAESDGLLLLTVFALSWMIAIGVGWVIWRLSPL